MYMQAILTQSGSTHTDAFAHTQIITEKVMGLREKTEEELGGRRRVETGVHI